MSSLIRQIVGVVQSTVEGVAPRTVFDNTRRFRYFDLPVSDTESDEDVPSRSFRLVVDPDLVPSDEGATADNVPAAVELGLDLVIYYRMPEGVDTLDAQLCAAEDAQDLSNAFRRPSHFNVLTGVQHCEVEPFEFDLPELGSALIPLTVSLRYTLNNEV